MIFKKHYPGLDLLRSIAIVLVMLAHFSQFGIKLPMASFWGGHLFWGTNGVDLFFALSGFLIGGQIIEEVIHNNFSFKKFFFKRVLRIFPPYYVSILVVSILYFSGIADSVTVTPGTTTKFFIKDIFQHLIYIQNYTSRLMQTGVYWTLAIEEQFYIIAPFLLFFLYRYARRFFLTGLVILILTCIVLRFLYFDLATISAFNFRLMFHYRFDSLLYGVLAAYILIVYKDKLLDFSKYFRVAVFALAICCIMISIIHGAKEDYFTVHWSLILSGVGFAMLTLWVVISPFATNMKGLKFFNLIAKLSYTMYLYHFLLFTPAKFIYMRYYIDSYFYFFTAFIFYFFFVVLVSFCIYQIVDRPCLSYRKKILQRWGDRRTFQASDNN